MSKKLITIGIGIALLVILIYLINEVPALGIGIGILGLVVLTMNRRTVVLGWMVIGLVTIICICLALFSSPSTRITSVQAKVVNTKTTISVPTLKATKVAKATSSETNPECILDRKWSKLPQISQWKKLITIACKDTGIESNLLAAVIYTESKGDSKVKSNQGAIGLMQVMPCDGLAKILHGSMFAERPTTKQLLKPSFNIRYGSRFLAQLLETYGNQYDALYAYNGGDPDYVPLVMQAYNNHLTPNE